jgi:hypothetical protein
VDRSVVSGQLPIQTWVGQITPLIIPKAFPPPGNVGLSKF